MPSRRLILAAPAILVAGEAFAHSYRFGDILIGHAWCQPSNGPSTRAMMPLQVTGPTPDALVGARTSAAEAVALMPVAGGPAASRWELQPRRPVPMRPDGPHLALIGLTRPLALRDRAPLTLVFERNGTTEVELWVERAPYSS